jgi:hypothetical protein
MKKIVLIFIVTAAHFTLSKLVPAMTLLLMDTDLFQRGFGHILSRFLVILTKVLYFPILSLVLYPRHWFPGYWINSVIFLNSLLWAVVIVLAIALYRRTRHLA